MCQEDGKSAGKSIEEEGAVQDDEPNFIVVSTPTPKDMTLRNKAFHVRL